MSLLKRINVPASTLLKLHYKTDRHSGQHVEGLVILNEASKLWNLPPLQLISTQVRTVCQQGKTKTARKRWKLEHVAQSQTGRQLTCPRPCKNTCRVPIQKPAANAASLTTKAALSQLKKDSNDILMCLYPPTPPHQQRMSGKVGEGSGWPSAVT